MDRQYSIQKSGGAQIDGTPPKTPLRYLTTYRGQALATKVTKVLYELLETRYLDPTPSCDDRQRGWEIVLHYTHMSAEHPINPEDIGRQIDGSFEIPLEENDDTKLGFPSAGSNPNIPDSIAGKHPGDLEKIQREQISLVSQETVNALASANKEQEEIKKLNHQAGETFQDYDDQAENIVQELQAAYDLYKVRAPGYDEEELLMVIRNGLKKLSAIHSKMDPTLPPTESSK